MTIEDIKKFKTLEEMQIIVEKELDTLKNKSEKYSKIIGDKLRENQDPAHDSDLAELKEKLDGPADPKKKKTVKKDKKSNWHDFDGISVFDGIGLKGELEIYFKALEETKSKIETLGKTMDAINNLISKGMRRDLGCVALIRHNLPSEMVFVKSNIVDEKKFSFKSIFSVYTEPIETDKSNTYSLNRV
ncbi:MAG TPA: hypothetical protein VLB45_06755 [Nitrosopumilaceae archaeon]|nr:hypothetical protein [Nitrosopumilaceae archaeon]